MQPNKQTLYHGMAYQINVCMLYEYVHYVHKQERDGRVCACVCVCL